MDPPTAFPPECLIPTDYLFKAGHLSLLRGSDLTVYHADGALAFRVHGGSDHRHVRILVDADNTPLVTVVHRQAGPSEAGPSDERVVDLELSDACVVDPAPGGWQGFRGNSLESKDFIFTVQKTFSSAFKTELEVILSGGNLGDPSSSFRLKGNPFQRSCNIYRGDSIVAQTSLLYKLRKVIYSRRKFRLTIFPGNDHPLIIAMLATFL